MIERAQRPGLIHLFVLLCALMAMPGCAVLEAPPQPPALDVTGIWDGLSVATCAGRMARCGGVVRISLAMIQNDSAISGTYRCSSRYAMCRSLNASGRIAVGEIRGPGVSLRVMFEDVSSCIFNGRFTAQSGGGAYVCLQGGIVERGFWQVRRSFGPPPAPWVG